MSVETDGGDGETTGRFEPAAIRSRLPSNLSDRQERALIAAMRNPDAPVSEVATATALEPKQVAHALDSLACGVLGASSHSNEWLDARGGEVRHAETFAELTEKQAAVVHSLARNPGIEANLDDMTNRELSAAVEAHAETDEFPAVHYTYPASVYETYDDLVHERRQYLVESGDLDLDENDEVVAVSLDREVSLSESPRELLERHGYDLPDENLDSLAVEGEALTDEERLDLAFERASDLDDEEPRGPTRPDAPPAPVGESEVVDVLDDDEFDDDDVEINRPYRGVVNGVVEWGVWFTIAGDPDDPDDVSGVVPVERLEPHGLEPSDYEAGDEGVVAPTGRSNVGDGKVRHRFALVTVENDESGDESESSTETTEGTDAAGETVGDAESDGYDTLTPEAVVEPAEFEELVETVAEQAERLDALERENERLREQVETNAEALPDDDTARELNEAAETVLDAEARLDAMSKKVDALADDVDDLAEHDAEKIHRNASRLDEIQSTLDDVRFERDNESVGAALETLDEAGYSVELTNDTN